MDGRKIKRVHSWDLKATVLPLWIPDVTVK
jgi:hypothetical protein